MRIVVLCAALGAAGVLRADELRQILERVARSIQRMPNYTCLETIERTRRGDPCAKCSITDRVRLEVGVIDGKERFAFPGAGSFEDKEIDELVKHWAIGSGDFATFLEDLFVAGVATYTARGDSQRKDATGVRYDYVVAPNRSGYNVRSNGLVARVGYHGSFWVDAESLELKRLEVRAERIPPELRVSSVSTAVSYAPLVVGSGRFVLPQSTDLEVVGLDGTAQTNRTRYTGCSQFVAQSEIRFDAGPVAEVAASVQGAVSTVPPGMKIEARLVKPIRMTEAGVGDPVEAVVTNQPRRSRRDVPVGKGAVLHGRILRLEVHDSGVRGGEAGGDLLPSGDQRPRGGQAPYSVFSNPKTFPAYTVIAIQFSSVETAGHRAEIHALLSDYSGVWQGSDGRSRIVTARDPAIQDRGEGGIVFFPGRLLEMKKDFALHLTTFSGR